MPQQCEPSSRSTSRGAGRGAYAAIPTAIRSMAGIISARATEGSAVTAQGEQRKAIAVQVVTDHEAGGELAPFDDAGAVLLADAVAGEAAAGERFLVPGPIGSLPIDEEVRPAGCSLAVRP